jgi:hypothetical protein
MQRLLEGEYRRRRILALDNINPSTQLQFKAAILQFKNARFTPDDAFKYDEATLLDRAKDVPFGTQLGFQLTNENAFAVRYFILTLGTEGTIEVLWPAPGGTDENVLAPGSKELLQFYLEVGPPHGVQAYKVIAMREMGTGGVHFDGLEFPSKPVSQRATRSGTSHPLSAFIEASAGRSSHTLRSGHGVSNRLEWTAINLIMNLVDR